jgi:hypothetical protein
MLPRKTRCGVRFTCPAPGCDVACWDGDTSTPADTETRRLRGLCHDAFDPLWQEAPRKFKSRAEAYQWLQKIMGLPKHYCHIGMFDKGQCEKLLKELAK